MTKNPLRFAFHHMYLFQLEEYNIMRYINLIVKTKGVPSGTPRKKMDWTPKALLLFILALGIMFFIAIRLIHTFNLPNYLFFLPLIILLYGTCIFIIVAAVFLFPIDYYLKKRIISKAKKKLRYHENLTIIGIAGSYGKTTMKEIVSTILSQKYNVLKTPENINTPIGISRLILKELDTTIEVMVVEMGEYSKGDVKEICDLTPPSISIVTGINEAHMERMGNIKTTIETIFELIQSMDPGGLAILNGDDRNITSHYEQYIKQQKTFLYHADNKMKVKTSLLGHYIRGTVQGAAAVASYLGLEESQIEKGVQLLKPLPHRLQPLPGANGTLVIDDSYNGNPDGVREAIRLLNSYDGRRKLFLTPGLVEGGESTKEIHYNIGKELSTVADLVILIKNSVTPFIEKGLVENGFDKTNIVFFDSAQEAHKSIPSLMKPNDVIVFQNDWPDNYL